MRIETIGYSMIISTAKLDGLLIADIFVTLPDFGAPIGFMVNCFNNENGLASLTVSPTTKLAEPLRRQIGSADR